MDIIRLFELAILSDDATTISEAYNKDSDIKKFLRSPHYLIYAVKNNKFEAVKALIETIKIPVNGSNYCHQPLAEAICNMSSDTKMIEYLISKGASLTRLDESGSDPITVAVKYRNLKALEALLVAGGNPNIVPNDWLFQPPLMVAVKNDDVTMAELLLKYGANPHSCWLTADIFEEAKRRDGRVYKLFLENESQSKRSNLISEGDGKRSNLISEGDGKRSNLISEGDGKRSNLISEGDGKRSNLISEGDGKRSNLISEGDGKRSNLISEGDGKQKEEICEDDEDSDDEKIEITITITGNKEKIDRIKKLIPKEYLV